MQVFLERIAHACDIGAIRLDKIQLLELGIELYESTANPVIEHLHAVGHGE
ncbi:hypothetical protein D3C83_65470 [compost metagenome]